MSRQLIKRKRVIIRRRLALLSVALIAMVAGATLATADNRDRQTEKAGAAAADPINRAVKRLKPGQLAGQRLISGVAGTEVSATLRGMIRRGEVAGVILFADNFPSRAAGRGLIRRLQRIKRPPALRSPLLIMIDQEGGLVKRIGGAPVVSAAEMGRRGQRFSFDQGRRTARNLINVGVNVNLAPVVDVGREGGDIAGTERAFGSTVKQVRRTALPFARGLSRGGVAATAKHFPGLGAARRNTDFARQVISLSKAKLRRIDMAPYRGFIATGGELVMLGTAIYPAFSQHPAAFTRSIAVGELRNRLGFRGVTITDAMGTVAVQDFGAAARATLAATRAGVDLLLYTDEAATARAHRQLTRRLVSGRLGAGAFRQSAERVLRLRENLRPTRG